jgi:RNA polymerase sigma-70 factor (ECF subfamily)
MVKPNETVHFTKLVTVVQLGDLESLDRLVRRIEPRLRRYIFSKTLDTQSVDDLAQETLLKMLRFVHGLKKAESFWPWLFHLANNVIADHFHKFRNSTALSDSICEETLQYDYDKFDADPVRRELRAVVDESISRLETRMRNVVYMRCFRDMSYRQIGSSVGLSQGATKALFFRAKQRIKRDLENSLSRFEIA